ncbi:MAG: glycosyltransferase [Sphaerochaeta sp.]|jgi:glycosyltransferase involved in cell wall biosynthesis|nr:glycosyltransferase [Sphaerochaeta sp.]
MDNLTPTIGVAVTTRNRPRQLARCVARIRQFSPPGTPIIVVDDASDIPAEGATYRFEKQAGIARAKNKCLELLDDTGAEHLFLFDDDCWPIKADWWKPYIESPQPHLMYIFQITRPTRVKWRITYRDSSHVAWNRPCGCMLYITRKALHKVGGMRTDFGLWGGEHGCWSQRIHNTGLTTWPFTDVKGSERLFYSMDEHWRQYKPEDFTRSIVDHHERFKNSRRNAILEQELSNIIEFVPYREAEPLDIELSNNGFDIGSSNEFFDNVPPNKPSRHWGIEYGWR